LYSTLAAFKSSSSYYTLGGLYSSIKENLSSMTVTMKIWKAFIRFLEAINEMLKKLINKDGIKPLLEELTRFLVNFNLVFNTA